MKILVIRFSSIGDIVLTTPVLRCLKSQIPGAEIHYLTKKQFFPLLEFNPHLSKIHCFDGNLFHLISALRKQKFDVVLDLHHNLRSLLFVLGLNRPTYTFSKLNFKKYLLVQFKLDTLPRIHLVERYLGTAKKLGLKDDGNGLEFHICPCEHLEKEDYPNDFQGKEYVVFSIGGAHKTKRMPAEKWTAVMPYIKGFPLIILGGAQDFEEGEIIRQNAAAKGLKIWNSCGQFTIGGSAFLVQNSKLVISNDTGMMHIAAAFQKPIVAIWGNTVPRFGMYPFRTPHFNMEVADLSCRPCSKIGFKSCPKSHFNCMNAQNFEQLGLQEFIWKALSE